MQKIVVARERGDFSSFPDRDESGGTYPVPQNLARLLCRPIRKS